MISNQINGELNRYRSKNVQILIIKMKLICENINLQ